MAQQKQLTWNELRVGLFVLIGIGLLVVAVFYVTATENPLARKMRLRTYFPEVAGLAPGAPVRLDGIDVGNVEDLQVNPAIGGPAADKARNIIVTLRILRKYQSNIRTDSVASPKTEGLLGDQYVNITRGFTGQALNDNGEIKGVPNPGIDELVANGTELASHMNDLIDNVQGIITDVRAGKGTVGQFMTNRSAYDHLDAMASKADTLLGTIQSGQGTLGQLISTDTTSKKLNAFLDHGNNVIEAVEQQKGSLGQFIYDPKVHTQLTQFLDKGNGLMDDVKNGSGTLSKLLYDDSLFATYKQAGTNLANATAKFNSNNGTVGRLFDDPKLYDNLTGLTGDLRSFMVEFQKNPKKFLSIQLRIF
ncbi:MAG TPA: MlaD family protein [Candidatus Acidoferrales bacterium]|nr:MlaD family protein [Candidatus Acidoferrales bacterium]